jgi:NAD(P)H-nitrite reductase large subunit
MHYVMIGNSIASTACIEAIRSIDRKGSITVIGEEDHPCYSRPLISYLLQGKTDENRMKYRTAAFYEENKVTVLQGTRATSIDREGKTVCLDGETTLSYDKLLLATGSSPFVPPIKGLGEVKNWFTFLTLDEAKRLQTHLKKESRVLILGAGLIGLKCAEGILDKVQSVSVVDLAPRVLMSVLDEASSIQVRVHLQEQGLRFYLGDSIQECTANEALLQSGIVIGFDLLVIAVGVKPNIQLASEAGLAVNRGILVDQGGRTGDPDIFAAGDCSEGPEMISGQRAVLALLPNAYLQGETAGKNMAGDEAGFDKAVAMNALSLMGLHLITVGRYEGESHVIPCKDGYKRLFVKDNHLVGCILVGEASKRAGIYTAMIRNKVELDSLDFDLICEEPLLMAFAKNVRQQQLGGPV